MKASHIILIVLVSAFLVGSAQAVATNWSYSAPGSFNWTCPANTTHVALQVTGAGGGGRGALFVAGSPDGYYYGLGGSAGAHQTVAEIDVVPGTNYTVIIGAQGTYGGVGNSPAPTAGSLSSALGYSKNGGAAGAQGGGMNHAGGDGDAGSFNTTRFAANGTGAVAYDSSTYPGGLGGLGFGAGGGGGAGSGWMGGGNGGIGGHGADGYVALYDTSTEGLPFNVPDFSAVPLIGIQGSLVRFTDESMINDEGNLTYLWDFGDGETSNVSGNTQHVYQWLGSFDVELTLTSDGGDVSERKVTYVNMVNEETELNLVGAPREVSFHLKEGWGTPLSDVTVSVQGVSTSAGSWDYIVGLLGIGIDETPINNTYMSQTTDRFGNAQMLMIPTVKYNVTLTKAGYTFSPSSPMLMVPDAEDYTFWGINASTDAAYFRHGEDELEAANITVVNTQINDTYSTITVYYNDSLEHTTGGTVEVLQQNATVGGEPVLLVSFPATGNTFTNSTTISHGTSEINGYVSTDVGQSDFGNITRSFPFVIRGAPVSILGLDANLKMLISFGLMFLILASAGATSARPMIVVSSMFGWVFWTMGWFGALTTRGMASNELVILGLTVMTILGVLANFEVRKKKEKY